MSVKCTRGEVVGRVGAWEGEGSHGSPYALGKSAFRETRQLQSLSSIVDFQSLTI